MTAATECFDSFAIWLEAQRALGAQFETLDDLAAAWEKHEAGRSAASICPECESGVHVACRDDEGTSAECACPCGEASSAATLCSRCGKQPAVAASCNTWPGPVCNGCSYLPEADPGDPTDVEAWGEVDH